MQQECGTDHPGTDAACGRKCCALIVGGEPWEYLLLENGLIRCGTVFGADTADPAEAETRCREGGYELVILAGLRTVSAAALIRTLRELPGHRQLLLIAPPDCSEADAQCCRAAGADLILRWPYSLRTLTGAVGRLTASRDTGDTAERCRRLLEEKGFILRMKGTHYICMAVQMLYGNGMLPMKSLYREIALRENTSPENVEGSVRTALRAAGWDGTGKEFLYRTAEELKRYENDEWNRSGD